MKSVVEVEQLLERMGNDWPAERSLVAGVMGKIESLPIVARQNRPGRRRLAPLLAAAAMLAIVTAVWWNSRGAGTLYAQAVAGIRQARTIYSVMTVKPPGDAPAQIAMQSWYEREVGFRSETGSEVRIGNPQNFWTFVKGSKLAVRSQSRGLDEILEQMLNGEALELLKQEHEPYPAGDQPIDGRPCRAYLVTKIRGAVDPDWQNGKLRLVVLVDEQSRIVRAVVEVRSDDRWLAQFTTDWKYDLAIDRALFEPRFDADVKIVDSDTLFDEMFGLDKAIYREERAGIWFAIHRAERFDGGIFVVSSVRGTEETLKKYPLVPHRVQPGVYFYEGPARHYDASPFETNFRLDLASASQRGIDVHWWAVVPRGGVTGEPELPPGKVRLPVGFTPMGEFARANFKDARGVINHETWKIVLDLPEPDVLPTLDEIARKVYADQVRLDVLATPMRSLDMGVKDDGGRLLGVRSDPAKTTAAEYSQAVAKHLKWGLKDAD